MQVLSELLADAEDRAALREFENQRLDNVNKIVLTNRSQPPDYIIETVDKLTGGSRSGS